MTQILILIGVLMGWFLRDLTTKKIEETQRIIKRKLLGNKSKVIEWTEPKSDEEQAEEEIRNKI